MSSKEKLTNMFTKVVAGTVTREEGAMLLNHLAKEDPDGALSELALLIKDPPPGVFAKTIIHMIALARNKAFYGIMVANLDHDNEDIPDIAAQEIARLKTAEAREVLSDRLNSAAVHVRKASATALVQNFSDGLEVVKRHMLLEQQRPMYRLTSAQALLSAGRKGVETLLSLLGSEDGDAVTTAAEALISAGNGLDQADIPRVFDALMSAGDREDARSIIEILKVAASLSGRARGFEGFIRAFSDHPLEPVRAEAQNALNRVLF